MNEAAKTMTSYCTIEQTHDLCFDLLTKEEAGFLEKNMVVITYRAGETICKQGSLANQIMIIREGLVKLYMENGPDRLVLQILPPNNIIGLSSCSETNSVFYASAQAYLDTIVQVIDMNAFRQVLQSNPAFTNKMLQFLAEQNVITYGRFFCLTRKQTYGRLADVLLCLANRIYKTKRFPLQLSRKELAELSDMSIESIARILTSFKNEKLIEVGSDYIELLEPGKLDEISRRG